MRKSKYQPLHDWIEVDRVSHCWIWLGDFNEQSYARMGRCGHYYTVHEYLYLCFHGQGSIPAGMVLDHICNNKRCVNPLHLEPKTAAANCRRGRNAKINMEIAREIRRSSDKGRDIAHRYGITEQVVSLIRSGKRWNEDDKPHMRKAAV